MIDDDILLNSISNYVFQTILSIERRHPQWLRDKFRKYPWQSQEFQLKFTTRLAAKLRQSENRDILINQLLAFLKSFFSPSFFISSQFTELMANVGRYTHTHPGIEIEAQEELKTRHNSIQNNCHHFPVKPSKGGFAILLLDAENLAIDADLEKILLSICTNPIKIKLAFGNWRNLGKKDLEFHNRGYELIHVPAGKNSADLKMISVGSSIWIHYPNAKEVLVCSSDGDLNHLSTTLTHHGLIVYKISRIANRLIVVNSTTSETKTYFLNNEPEMPILEDFIQKIKDIIKEEQNRINQTWIKLEKIAQLFQYKYNLSLTQIISHYFPHKKTREFFLDLKTDFVVHQITTDSFVYLTIFDDNLDIKEKKQHKIILSTSKKVDLTSKNELETAIYQIVDTLSHKSDQEFVPICSVATQFNQEYTIPITKAMKNLNLGSKFSKLLQSFSSLKVKKIDKSYHVALTAKTDSN